MGTIIYEHSWLILLIGNSSCRKTHPSLQKSKKYSHQRSVPGKKIRKKLRQNCGNLDVMGYIIEHGTQEPLVLTILPDPTDPWRKELRSTLLQVAWTKKVTVMIALASHGPIDPSSLQVYLMRRIREKGFLEGDFQHHPGRLIVMTTKIRISIPPPLKSRDQRGLRSVSTSSKLFQNSLLGGALACSPETGAVFRVVSSKSSILSAVF